VARRFLAVAKECSDLKMAMFISCDAADVMRQAEDSTRRYQQGTSLIQHLLLLVVMVLNVAITIEIHHTATSQQYFSLTTNQHQLLATASQTKLSFPLASSWATPEQLSRSGF